MCWDLFGPARMHSDTFGSVQKRSEAFRLFEILWTFSTFFALVPNTSEANDEMCGPTAPKFSEMCSLKPFSCLLLFVVAALAEQKTKTVFASK